MVSEVSLGLRYYKAVFEGQQPTKTWRIYTKEDRHCYFTAEAEHIAARSIQGVGHVSYTWDPDRDGGEKHGRNQAWYELECCRSA